MLRRLKVAQPALVLVASVIAAVALLATPALAHHKADHATGPVRRRWWRRRR
ncbi:MAG: hypothetical protein ACRDJJ_07210 [Actinomycetota bacterium]